MFCNDNTFMSIGKNLQEIDEYLANANKDYILNICKILMNIMKRQQGELWLSFKNISANALKPLIHKFSMWNEL